jgi:serine protease Do
MKICGLTVMKKHVISLVSLVTLSCLVLIVILAGCTGTAGETTPDTSQFSFSDTVDKVMPSVVFIFVEMEEDIFGRVVSASGSGVILSSDGYILTNRHVVKGANRIEVTLQDRSVYEASDVWMDDILDLAVVKIEAQNLKAAEFGDPASIRVGDWAIALGHPLGLSPEEGGATVTVGVVSNLGRSLYIGRVPYYDVIQIDTAINPGNSGGPLVNTRGEVIGINSAGAGEAQNINFAINVRTARRVFEDLVEYGEVLRPYLGVDLGDITPEVACDLCLTRRIGTVITSVEPDGPADLAGLQEGDVIVQFGGKEIISAVTLINELWAYRYGDIVSVTLWRGDSEIKTSVTLTERPDQSFLLWLNIHPASEIRVE